MCGYFSTFFKSIKLDADTNAKRINSLKLLHHRGPDDVKFVNHFNNSLGFCRLSIIDENTGSQICLIMINLRLFYLMEKYLIIRS